MATSSKAVFVNQFRKARAAGVPFIAVETTDNFAAINRMQASLKAETPMIQWDNIQGWSAVNNAGRVMLEGDKENGILSIFEDTTPGNALAGLDVSATIALANCLMMAKHLPKLVKEPKAIPGCVLFLHNVHEYQKEPDITQAVLNLREAFRSTNRTLVMVGPHFEFAQQLVNHVYHLIEPLPTPDELEEMVRQMATNSGIDLTEDSLRRSVEALMGLNQFAAAQGLALAFDKKNRTINFDELWHRKYEMIRQTLGLRLDQSGLVLDDVKGCSRIKWFCEMIANGPFPPDLICVFDEGEKGFAAGDGRNDGGIGKGFLGTVLTEMEENDYTGMINYGLPGTGKSMIAKAMAGTLKVPCIFIDLKGMQQGIIGSSEANLRRAFAVIKAMTKGNPLFFMTSNDLDSIPIELQARLGMGKWMFDGHSAEERADMFAANVKKYELSEAQADYATLVNQPMVGREVKAICKISRQTGMPLSQAFGQIALQEVTEARKIGSIRRQGHLKYLSTTKEGLYEMPGYVATGKQKPGQAEEIVSTDALVVAEDDI